MTMPVREIAVTTRCAHCGGILNSAEDWRQHRRRHWMEDFSTREPEAQRILDDLRDAGFTL